MPRRSSADLPIMAAAGRGSRARASPISAPAQPQHAARPPAGRPAPQPAPCRPRLQAWAPAGFGPPRAGGPGPAQSNRHPEDAQAALGPRRPGGLGREALPSREPPGFRPAPLLKALGAAASSPPWNPGPRPGLPVGSGAGGPGERAGLGAGGGRAARDRSGGSQLASSALPGSGPRAARRGGLGWAGPGRGSRSLLRERRLALRETSEASLPPGWRGLVTQVDWGTLEYGALPTFLQVRRRQRRHFKEEGAESFCTQK
ncbi:hypothetical protein AB1E18_003113 [Capra hircus]